MKKHVSIIVVPHDNAKTINLRFSWRLLYTFATLAVLLLFAIVFFIVTYGHVLMTAEEARQLTNENQKLRARAAQIDSLELELVNLQALSIQIKRMLGVNLSRDDSLFVANYSPVSKSSALVLESETAGVGRSEQKRMLESMPTVWPVTGFVTRGFHITGGEKTADYHPGIDIAAERSTPIKASAEGVVVASSFDGSYGYMVEIDHGFGIYSLYGHNERNLVKVGDRVARGKTIAYVGSTGNSTAPHLHFEVRKNGVPVDPRKYLLN